MADVPELTPTEFQQRWGDEQLEARDVVLLDVREPEEVALAALPGARYVPMREIPSRLGELEHGKPLVIMCHSGVRSRRVAEFLTANGFDRVFNLAGGIDAWSREIDPRIPRY
jgi:rhodanese-related sulfurtransferase